MEVKEDVGGAAEDQGEADLVLGEECGSFRCSGNILSYKFQVFFSGTEEIFMVFSLFYFSIYMSF